jgi:cytochrome P450
MTASLIERAAETVIIVAALWPAIPSSVNRSFWRAFPEFARRLLTGVVASLLVVTALVLWGPDWLRRGIGVTAVLWMIALRWHARIAQGSQHGRPPGSLRILPLDAWFSRAFFLEQSRRLGSPFKTSHFFRPMVCFVGLSDGLQFLSKHDAALSSPPLPFARFIPDGFIRHMAPERHAVTRQIFRKVLSREIYEPLEPFVRDTIRNELAHLAASGESTSGGVAPRPQIQRLLFRIWTRLFFNISSADGLARLKQLYRVIDIRNPTRASDRSINRALDEVDAIVKRQLHDDQAVPRPAAPRSFFEAVAATNPEAVDDPTVVRNLIYLLHTSWADVSGLLTWLWRMLTEHPEWADRVRQARDAGDGGVETLPTRIVMETLRLEQSEQLYRLADRHIEHRDFVIPRGWLVRLCVRESHQDPAVFDCPEQFDPDRFVNRSFSRREYSAFGGALDHACLGEGLTMMVGRIFVEELSNGFVWRTIADGEYEYGPWRHWRPSSNWRVAITPI